MNYETNKPKAIGELLKLPRREGRTNEDEYKNTQPTVGKKSANSERASLIGQFTDKLNLSRDGKKYKKLSQ